MCPEQRNDNNNQTKSISNSHHHQVVPVQATFVWAVQAQQQ
jgi:hypothetical protein